MARKQTTPPPDPSAEPTPAPEGRPVEPPVLDTAPIEPTAPPSTTPPPDPSAELVPVDSHGPGLYLCTRTCYGKITYRAGCKYHLDHNIAPTHFARIGDG